MSSLSNDQKQLLFDYCFGLTSDDETTQAEKLVSSNKDAADIHRKLQTTLAPLGSLELELCPNALAELTISRLTNLANSGHDQLEHLLETEQKRPIKIKVGFWHNVGEMVAVAAMILLVAGVLVPSLGLARHKYWKQRCQTQLGGIFQGLNNYVSDHDEQYPCVPTEPGKPWSTQSLYLLIKLDYVKDPTIFVCPGRSRGGVRGLDISVVQKYSDFPDRGDIFYSPRIICPETPSKGAFVRGPLLSDRNPIFEDWSADERKLLDDTLFNVNSRNHKSQGQNILFDDGRVEFIRIRRIGETGDDIFTAQGMERGSEINCCERPTHETDIYLAP